MVFKVETGLHGPEDADPGLCRSNRWDYGRLLLGEYLKTWTH